MTAAEQKELKELRAFKAIVEPTLNAIYDVLYFDDNEDRYDPDKEWDSAADVLETVADNITDVIPAPKRRTTERPAYKVKS